MTAMIDDPPTRPAARNRRLSALRGLLPFLRPYRRRIVIAAVLLVLASATLLTVPAAFREMIDEGFIRHTVAARTAAPIYPHFLLLFGLTTLWALLVGCRLYVVSWLGERVTADLRSAVYSHVLKQSPQFFETLQTGEVLSRLTGDTTLVQTVVGSSISMGLRSSLQATGGMIMLAVTSFKLFIINMGLLLFLVLPLLVIGRRVRRLSRQSQDRIADASAVAGEILNAAPTVQAFTHEQRESRRFAAVVEKSFRTALQRVRVRSLLASLVISVVFGAIIFVLWIGARAVVAGSMTGGQLTSFVLYAVFVAGGASTLAEVWGDVMRAAGATERLMELLHAKSPIESPPDPKALPCQRQARVTFEAVSFRYPSRPAVPALADVSLEVRPGETVALVGPSGAGKSTMFQLILRFFDVSAGRVTFNGVDVRALSLEALRGAVAVVPQDPVIFSANALENIRYGRPAATDEEVMAAARAALADEFISRLPQGYQTFLGERGMRLSGGQRQRLAIARAMLRNAPLLLLDEATSALDSESEQLVQQGLAAAMRDRTTIIIAHRLSTVQQADRIVVLEHGRVVETGTPAGLKNSGGLYARLAELQLATA